MAKLPRWMKVIETKDKGRTVVIVIRWWHPHIWWLLWDECRWRMIDNDMNPKHIANQWLILKTVVQTVWQQAKRSWTF